MYSLQNGRGRGDTLLLSICIFTKTGKKGNITFMINKRQQLNFIFLLSLLKCECEACRSIRTLADVWGRKPSTLLGNQVT